MSTTLEGPPEGLNVPETRRVQAPMADMEVREDGERLIFQGHAAVFDRLSEDLGGFRERIQRGAFRKVLDANPDVRFLVNHDSMSATGLPLARTTNNTLELREDPKGLRVYAELAPTTLAKDLRVLVKRGDVDQMSFGFSMRDENGDLAGKDVWTEGDTGLERTSCRSAGCSTSRPS
jgi:HK97 family phage prohead protease